MGSSPGGEPVAVIGYIRVSMAREEMISPETQQAAIADWARRKGRTVIDWITDLDKTGRNFNRRIMDGIARVEAGEAREIAVWKYSRFGRNRTGVALNLARLEKAGGELVSATEEVDAGTATGRFTRGMLFEVAAFESDRTAETWRETYQHRVSGGLPPLGRARFGYQRLGRVRHEQDPQRTRRATPEAKESYAPDPELGPVLAEMYRSYIGGDGGGVIAQRLNRQGIPNTYGNTWGGRTVIDVLDSGFGAGYLRIHSVSCKCREAARCPERDFIPGAHDPVISDEEWEQYNQRRAEVKKTPPRHRSPVYPISALVRCGHCGHAIVAASPVRKNGDITFRCSHAMLKPGECDGNPSVPLSALMEAVRAFLKPIAPDIDARAKVVKARDRASRSVRTDKEKTVRELAAVERALVRLAVQRAEDESGKMGAPVWEKATAELKAKRDLLQEQMASAAQEASALSSDPIPAIIGIMDAWDILPAAGMNKLLRTVVRVIKVWRTGQAARDAQGHFLPAPARIKVIPRWAPLAEEDSR